MSEDQQQQFLNNGQNNKEKENEEQESENSEMKEQIRQINSSKIIENIKISNKNNVFLATQDLFIPLQESQNTQAAIPAESKKQQYLKKYYPNLTPKEQINESFSQQLIAIESDHKLARKSLGNSYTNNNKSRRSKQQQELCKGKNNQSMNDDMFTCLQRQSIMRSIFNKIKLQIQISTFISKMIQILKRKQLLQFQSHKMFYTALNDKAAFYNAEFVQQYQQQKQVISQTLLYHQNNHQHNQLDKTTTKNKSQNPQTNNSSNNNPNTNNCITKSTKIKLSKIKILLQKPFNKLNKFFNLSDETKLKFLQYLKKIKVFSTFSKYRIFWEYLQLLCLGFLFIFIPLILVFNLSILDILNSSIIINLIIVILFLDIIINFNTSLFQQGREIRDHLSIALYYLKHGFITDIITLISLIIFVGLDKYREINEIQAIKNSIILLFYFRFYQFSRVLKKIEIQYHFSPMNLLLMNIYIIHLLSCFWILLGKLENQSKNAWIQVFELSNEQWYIQFMTAFYYITVTMVTVGYGDIHPNTNIERFFCIIVVLSACCVFAYSISEVGSIFQEMNKSIKKRKNKMFIINDYMKKKRITQDLQYQIRHYLEYYWNESLSEKSNKELKIINQLSNNLKENLMIEANRLFIVESPFFRDNFSFKTISKTVSIVTEQRCTPEEIVFLEGDIDDASIYFIEKGSVQYFHSYEQSSNSSNAQISIYKQGQYFGEYCFFTNQVRSLSFRSLEFTTLIKIERKKFLEILQETPSDFERFCMIKDDLIFNKNFGSIRKECSFCKDKPGLETYHFENKCPMLHFIPNYTKIEENRKQFNRSKEMKFNTRGRIEQVQGDQDRFIFTQQPLIQQYLLINSADQDIQTSRYNLINYSETDEDENDNDDEDDQDTSNSDTSSNSSHSSNEQKQKQKKNSQEFTDDADDDSGLQIKKSNNPSSQKQIRSGKHQQIDTLKLKNKNSIIQEDDLETESPLKLKYPQKQIIKRLGQNDQNNNNLEELSLPSLEEEICDQDKANLHQSSSFIFINQIMPLSFPSNLQLPKSNSSIDKQIQIEYDDNKNNNNNDNRNDNFQNNKNINNTESHNSLTTNRLMKSKTVEYSNRNKSHSFERHQYSSKTLKSSDRHSDKSDRLTFSLKCKKIPSLNSVDQKKSTKNILNGCNDSEKKQHSRNSQVTFQLPEKKYKHRNSKSLQEMIHDSDSQQQQLQLQQQIKHNNLIKQTSSEKIISQSFHYPFHSHNHHNHHKSIHPSSTNSYKIIKPHSQTSLTGSGIFDKKHNYSLLDTSKNDSHSQHNNNSNIDSQRFNLKLDDLVINLKKIQDTLAVQNQESHTNNYQTRYFRQNMNIEQNQSKEFDIMKIFEVYFPYNNYDRIIEEYSQRIINKKNKINSRLSNIFQNKLITYMNNSSNSFINVTQTQFNDQYITYNNNNPNLSDIFSQNSLNRLKLLKNNYRKNSISEQLLLPLNQRYKNSEGKESSPFNKRLNTMQSIEEDFTSSLLGSNTTKNNNNNNNNNYNFTQKCNNINPPIHNLQIPNYFGLQSESSQTNIHKQTHKSLFSNKTSHTIKLAQEETSSQSQSDTKIYNKNNENNNNNNKHSNNSKTYQK